MLGTIGHVFALMAATIASLFAGHVVGDAAPQPQYISVPGSLLTVPNIFGHPAQNTAPQPSTLTASAAASESTAAHQDPAPAPAPSAASTSTPDTKPDTPQGILCNGKYYDACPTDTVFQCVAEGRVCRTTSVAAQVLSATPKLSDCQIQENQLSSQIDALRQQGVVADASSTDDSAVKLADLISRLHSLQSTCNP